MTKRKPIYIYHVYKQTSADKSDELIYRGQYPRTCRVAAWKHIKDPITKMIRYEGTPLYGSRDYGESCKYLAIPVEVKHWWERIFI